MRPKKGTQVYPAQARPQKKSGKKPDPENPGKNPDIKFLFFGSDFKNGHYKLQFYGIMQIFYVIFKNFYLHGSVNFDQIKPFYAIIRPDSHFPEYFGWF